MQVHVTNVGYCSCLIVDFCDSFPPLLLLLHLCLLFPSLSTFARSTLARSSLARFSLAQFSRFSCFYPTIIISYSQGNEVTWLLVRHQFWWFCITHVRVPELAEIGVPPTIISFLCWNAIKWAVAQFSNQSGTIVRVTKKFPLISMAEAKFA